MPDIKYKKGLEWSRALTPKMKEFKKETGKNAVYRGHITGGFEYWLYWSKKTTPTKPKPKYKPVKKPAKKPAKPKKEIKPITKKVTDDKIYQNYLQKIEKCEKNIVCSKFQVNKIQKNITEDYKHDLISYEKAQKLMKYAQKVYDNKVKQELGIKPPKKSPKSPVRKPKPIDKPKIKVTIHLPYGKADNLFLTINFVSSKIKNENKKIINNIIEDKWADMYMYKPTGYLRFSHIIFDTDGDIYLKYRIEFVIYNTKKDLEEIFGDLANIIYKESKFLPTSIRVTANYTEDWIKKYKSTKRKIDSLSPYERIVIKELDYNKPSSKLALVRELKQKYPKSQFSMITFSRYSTNLFKHQYIIHTGITSGGLGRIKLSKEGKLIQDLLAWN